MMEEKDIDALLDALTEARSRAVNPDSLSSFIDRKIKAGREDGDDDSKV